MKVIEHVLIFATANIYITKIKVIVSKNIKHAHLPSTEVLKIEFEWEVTQFSGYCILILLVDE